MQRDQNLLKTKGHEKFIFQLWLMGGNTMFADLKRRNLLKD
jgi:hypothetical protein